MSEHDVDGKRRQTTGQVLDVQRRIEEALAPLSPAARQRVMLRIVAEARASLEAAEPTPGPEWDEDVATAQAVINVAKEVLE